MLSVAIILAIALAIFLGYKTKINTGLFCIVFAYIIGCFVMGLKPKQVIGYWPTSTMFVILSVSLFYNFAAINGTLEKMSGALLYACRKFPGLLPYALLAVAVILSVMGATYFTVLAFLAPITLVICDESRMDQADRSGGYQLRRTGWRKFSDPPIWALFSADWPIPRSRLLRMWQQWRPLEWK